MKINAKVELDGVTGFWVHLSAEVGVDGVDVGVEGVEAYSEEEASEAARNDSDADPSVGYYYAGSYTQPSLAEYLAAFEGGADFQQAAEEGLFDHLAAEQARRDAKWDEALAEDQRRTYAARSRRDRDPRNWQYA